MAFGFYLPSCLLLTVTLSQGHWRRAQRTTLSKRQETSFKVEASQILGLVKVKLRRKARHGSLHLPKELFLLGSWNRIPTAGSCFSGGGEVDHLMSGTFSHCAA